MRRVALLAILSWLALPALGCSTSPSTLDNPDSALSSDDASGSDSSVTGNGPITDGGAGGDGGNGSADGTTGSGGKPLYCDSGAPLALKSTWPMPAVDTHDGVGMTTDSQGNVYISGIFNGSVKFGSTTLTAPTAPGTSNMFLVKFDPSGNVLLAKSWGTTTGIYLPPAIAVDSAGNVFLGGMFANTLDFGGSSTALKAVSYGDGFAVKLSPAGDALWATRFGYNDGAAILSITMAPDGNPIVAGAAWGDIIFGSKTYMAATTTTQQPFIAKLSTSSGAVLWGNATGGDIKSGEDIFVSTDSSGHVFVAARVESGGGAWGGGADGGNFSALRAGFTPDGAIMWGQVDYGAFPVAAAVDHAGRFWVVLDGQNTVTLGGTSQTFGDGGSGSHSVSALFSPVDGTLLSGFDITDTFVFPNSGAVDGRGNSVVTGTYWPDITLKPDLAGLTLPSSSQNNQPTFVAVLDGLSRPLASLAVATTADGQPYAMTVDPASGNIYVLGTLGTSTSDSGGKVPSLVIAVFGPDPCNDGAGPSGPSTGTPGNHGVLGSDGGSTYVVPDAGAPAACPASSAAAVNGAACPVARGCSYGTTCCICAPVACMGQPTEWTCSALQNDPACPSSPPTPGTACPSTTLKCNYCETGGRLYANCNAGGWSTGYAQILCQ